LIVAAVGVNRWVDESEWSHTWLYLCVQPISR